MGITTTGWHRLGSVTSRATFGLEQQTVPGASILVTETGSGALANIFSDPLLSVRIPGSLLTADQDGNYDYYLGLNYCVTESISAPNGGLAVLVNISQNGPIAVSFVTSANPSDTLSVIGASSNSHVVLFPTNAIAATMVMTSPGVYVSDKIADSITITHPVTNDAAFDMLVTTY